MPARRASPCRFSEKRGGGISSAKAERCTIRQSRAQYLHRGRSGTGTRAGIGLIRTPHARPEAQHKAREDSSRVGSARQTDRGQIRGCVITSQARSSPSKVRFPTRLPNGIYGSRRLKCVRPLFPLRSPIAKREDLCFPTSMGRGGDDRPYRLLCTRSRPALPRGYSTRRTSVIRSLQCLPWEEPTSLLAASIARCRSCSQRCTSQQSVAPVALLRVAASWSWAGAQP